MKTNFVDRLLIIIIVILALSSSLRAVDVPGPYNNRQTHLEYTLNADNQPWLYALNARDKPMLSDNGQDFCIFGRMDVSDSWTRYPFRTLGGQPIFEHSIYPILLSRNNQPHLNDWLCMTAFNSQGQVASTLRNQGGLRWETFTPEFPPYATCMAVSRTNPQMQWSGFHAEDGLSSIPKTEDGWITSDYVNAQGLPQLPGVPGVGFDAYVLTMDERSTTQQLVAVFSYVDPFQPEITRYTLPYLGEVGSAQT